MKEIYNLHVKLTNELFCNSMYFLSVVSTFGVLTLKFYVAFNLTTDFEYSDFPDHY